MVELHEGRPEDLEAEGHGAEHDFADLRVGEVLFKDDRHGREEEAERESLEGVQDHQQDHLREFFVEHPRFFI